MRHEAARQEQIRRSLGLLEAPSVKMATTDDVLALLQAASLGEWRNRTDALPQRCQQARLETAKIGAPKARPVTLPKATLHIGEELEEWLEKARSVLATALEDGPVIV